MVSPVVHDHGFGQDAATPTGSFTISLANVASGDMIILQFNSINTHNAYSDISSITGIGGTWTRRTQQQFQFSTASSDKVNTEVWWNNTPSSTGTVTITVNYNLNGMTSVDSACAKAFRVTGCNSASPWDSNVNLPAVAINNTGTPSTLTNQVSTSFADDLILALHYNQSSSTGTSVPTWSPGTFTLLDNSNDTHGAWGCYGYNATDSVSATQSNVTVTDGVSKVHEIFMIDAVTADSSAPPPPPTVTVVICQG